MPKLQDIYSDIASSRTDFYALMILSIPDKPARLPAR
ncbi:MAG: hypothetical protein K0Q94_5694 [Paenibacillus sp.]|jgi:hypothetical protein|nr:hypothetical protein [Paenibacillus sp.]